MWPGARVYLELQHVPDVPLANKLPIGVFTDRLTTLNCEMRDGGQRQLFLSSGDNYNLAVAQG
jgi:hypothetical protein